MRSRRSCFARSVRVGYTPPSPHSNGPGLPPNQLQFFAAGRPSRTAAIAVRDGPRTCRNTRTPRSGTWYCRSWSNCSGSQDRRARGGRLRRRIEGFDRPATIPQEQPACTTTPRLPGICSATRLDSSPLRLELHHFRFLFPSRLAGASPEHGQYLETIPGTEARERERRASCVLWGVWRGCCVLKECEGH
jgi:hypothetical protein